MLKGKELILATKPFAKEDRKRSWFALLSTFIILVGLLTTIVFAPSLWIKVLASLLYSLVLVRMFIIYHDFLHHTILHRNKFADVLMTVFGLYILAPKSIWKRSHDYHHNHNSKLFSASVGSYPIVTKSKFESMRTGERLTYLFVRHPLTICFAYFIMFIYGMCIGSLISAPKRHVDSALALLLHAAGSLFVVWYVGWGLYFLAVFVPFFISSAIGAYLFYAQHNFPGVSFAANKDWAYEKAALESSSYMKMNRMMAWFTGNIGYHHIHHLNSRIPFYRLPEAMENIPELQNPRTTSLSPKDIIACFRLKVWDPERNRMIGFEEIGK
jgi:omega-6 fatty acid desaturase (delta-12 desaturase)